MRKLIFLGCYLLCCNAFSQEVSENNSFRYPVYAGISGGYGSTTWNGLVPSLQNQNVALNISTPTFVQEGGGVWGLFAGYEFSPYFAIEANYARYSDATVTFDPDSLFAFDNNGRTVLTTHTQMASIMGKVMLIIPHTTLRLYSSAGVARVERNDDINSKWRISPSFGVGVTYNFTPRVMGELGSNYTAGYGESELNPAMDFVPFLYSVFFKVGLRF